MRCNEVWNASVASVSCMKLVSGRCGVKLCVLESYVVDTHMIWLCYLFWVPAFQMYRLWVSLLILLDCE